MEEIKEVVWDCGNEKALGPDGFTFHIVKALWATMADDIKQLIDDFHSKGKLVKGLNNSFIVLCRRRKTHSLWMNLGLSVLLIACTNPSEMPCK